MTTSPHISKAGRGSIMFNFHVAVVAVLICCLKSSFVQNLLPATSTNDPSQLTSTIVLLISSFVVSLSVVVLFPQTPWLAELTTDGLSELTDRAWITVLHTCLCVLIGTIVAWPILHFAIGLDAGIFVKCWFALFLCMVESALFTHLCVLRFGLAVGSGICGSIQLIKLLFRKLIVLMYRKHYTGAPGMCTDVDVRTAALGCSTGNRFLGAIDFTEETDAECYGVTLAWIAVDIIVYWLWYTRRQTIAPVSSPDGDALLREFAMKVFNRVQWQ